MRARALHLAYETLICCAGASIHCMLYVYYTQIRSDRVGPRRLQTPLASFTNKRHAHCNTERERVSEKEEGETKVSHFGLYGFSLASVRNRLRVRATCPCACMLIIIHVDYLCVRAQVRVCQLALHSIRTLCLLASQFEPPCT